MNIGIDGNLLAISYPSGLQNYLKSLLFALAKIDKKNQYYIFVNSKVKIPRQKNFKLVIIHNKFPILKRQIFIPLTVRKYDIDVFHYPCDTWISAFFRHSNSVVTLADFGSHNAYPKWYENPKSFLIGKYYNFMRKSLINTCSHILPISNTIKAEAKENGIPNSKMTTIYLGVDRVFKYTKGQTRQHFLAFADFSPRKNILAVMKAYSNFIKNSKIKHPLIIITSDRRPHSSIYKTASMLGTTKLIRVETNVSTKKLVHLYNSAIALLYPSLYEGFGLPIIEAMSAGCPVVTSNYGATKEIAGDAAILINPKNAKEISDSMVRIAESKSLQQKFISLGLKQSKKFTWRRTATETLKVYGYRY